jgi:hypothetical protein
MYSYYVCSKLGIFYDCMYCSSNSRIRYLMWYIYICTLQGIMRTNKTMIFSSIIRCRILGTWKWIMRFKILDCYYARIYYEPRMEPQSSIKLKTTTVPSSPDQEPMSISISTQEYALPTERRRKVEPRKANSRSDIFSTFPHRYVVHYIMYFHRGKSVVSYEK